MDIKCWPRKNQGHGLIVIESIEKGDLPLLQKKDAVGTNNNHGPIQGYLMQGRERLNSILVTRVREYAAQPKL